MFDVQDLLLAEPRLRPVGRPRSIQAEGLCRVGDGDTAGWLVLVDLTSPGSLNTGRAPAPDDADTTSIHTLLRQCSDAAAVLCRSHSPSAQVEAAAESLGLPLIHVPSQVTPRELISLVQGLNSARTDTRAWRRLNALGVLAESLASKAPEQSLLTKYSEITTNVGLVISQDGEIVASVGELPVRTIERTVRGAEPRMRQFSIGRWLLSAFPVEPELTSWSLGSGYWLVLGKRAASASAYVAQSAPVASALIQLLKVAARSRQQHSRAEQLRDSRVVSELVYGTSDPERLELQMISRGFSRDAGYRVVVAGHGVVATDPGIAVEALERAANNKLPVVVSSLERTLVLVVAEQPNEGARRSALESLCAALPSPVGISGLATSVDLGSCLYRQARLAKLAASLSDAPHIPAHFERCRPLVKAVGALDDAAARSLAAAVEQKLGSIADGGRFASALVEESFDVRRVAKRMQVHPNTVRNRQAALLGDGVLKASDIELWYFTAGARTSNFDTEEK